MSEPDPFLFTSVTCRRCLVRGVDGNDHKIDRDRRLLAQVRWSDPPQVTVAKRWNQRAVEQAWAIPGQPASLRPMRTPTDKGRGGKMVVLSGDELVEVSCDGCGRRFKYRRAEFISMASRARDVGEVGIKPNLGRSLR